MGTRIWKSDYFDVSIKTSIKWTYSFVQLEMKISFFMIKIFICEE